MDDFDTTSREVTAPLKKLLGTIAFTSYILAIRLLPPLCFLLCRKIVFRFADNLANTSSLSISKEKAKHFVSLAVGTAYSCKEEMAKVFRSLSRVNTQNCGVGSLGAFILVSLMYVTMSKTNTMRVSMGEFIPSLYQLL
ncbi:hypothetical protein BHM03_00002921 [Ensete ventricosum]|nr:hypothetical protein BHM03_00002921 [Ensete ventricosum]